MNNELLPCPFCGGRAEIKEGKYTKYVMCLKCETFGPNLTSSRELVEHWNQRAHDAHKGGGVSDAMARKIIEKLPLGAAAYIGTDDMRAALEAAGCGVDNGPMRDILDEVRRATAKFPTWPTDPLHAVGVVNEEVGELSKAVLQQVYEPHKNKPDDVRTEAIQAAAMLVRFIASLEVYKFIPGEQHSQNDRAIGADHD